jgi:hypothetical protein
MVSRIVKMISPTAVRNLLVVVALLFDTDDFSGVRFTFFVNVMCECLQQVVWIVVSGVQVVTACTDRCTESK